MKRRPGKRLVFSVNAVALWPMILPANFSFSLLMTMKARYKRPKNIQRACELGSGVCYAERWRRWGEEGGFGELEVVETTQLVKQNQREQRIPPLRTSYLETYIEENQYLQALCDEDNRRGEKL
jgi:hypothetical protein